MFFICYLRPSLSFFRGLVIASPLFFLNRCHEARTESLDVSKREFKSDVNFVDTIILKKTIFRNELISNGQLKAVRKSELRFKVSGTLEKVMVKNGDEVTQGETIARLGQFEFLQRLEQAETTLKNSKIELQDMIMSYTGGRSDSAAISPEIYETTAIRSGYITALRELKTAQFNLEATVIKAPFGGKVANIKSKVHEQTGSGDPFCLIIDDTEFEVEFYLIESEIQQVSLSDPVSVIPFSHQATYKGYISEINPIINENGLVMVKARVRNPGPLWEGMNVKVIVEKMVRDQLVVPKSAILHHQDQEVLFKYSNRKACWVYVKTELENSQYFSVAAYPGKGGKLTAGDTVIISGNLNLAHNSDVVVKRQP